MKIRTLVAICVFGFIGTINANPASHNNAGNKVVVEEGKNPKIGLAKANESSVGLTEKTSLKSDAKIESVQFLQNEDATTEIDLQKEARLVTKLIVDQKEAKVIEELITDGKLVGNI